VAEFTCRGCGGTVLDVVLELGDVPASDSFPRIDDPAPDPEWPLALALCPVCLLVQLGPTDAAAPQPPAAVESATSLAHAITAARDVARAEGLSSGSTFIELDSHHGGSWRDEFVRLGLHEVEAAGQADLVVDVHAVAHEPELAAPLAAHAARVAPGGRLVLEFHHLLPLVEQSQVDTIRHGHWVYLSALSMQRLLREHGLTLTRAVAVDTFGGSLRLTAGRTQDDPAVDHSVVDLLEEERAAGLDDARVLSAVGVRGRERAAALRAHLIDIRAQGRTVAGYGAPSKAAVLLAVADVGSDLLPYTVDLSPAKHGCRIPGAGVPIRPVDALAQDRPDEVVVLTWDIADEIATQLSGMAPGWDPSLFVPMPEAREMRLRHVATAPPNG
jgi:hypothetical protein